MKFVVFKAFKECERDRASICRSSYSYHYKHRELTRRKFLSLSLPRIVVTLRFIKPGRFIFKEANASNSERFLQVSFPSL